MDSGGGDADPGTAIVGRDSEFAVIEGFLSAENRGGCLVLSGQPGIGKTALWDAGVAVAKAGGQLVLTARASEAEAGLAFAALVDLFEDVPPHAFERLPVPQRHALEVALQRDEPVGESPGALAISVAVLSVLRAFTERSPVLVALDDVQWLDASSADVLRYAARRLAGQNTSGVRLLLARRSDQRTALETAWSSRPAERIELSGLSVGAITHLVRERLGLALPRHLVRRLHESSAGNPLFALEMARLFKEEGLPAVGSELPVPEVVDELFSERVGSLSPPVRRVVLAVSLSGGISWSDLERVVDGPAMEEALRLGLLALDRSRLRVSHPLLGAAAVRCSTPTELRETHRALGSVADDLVLRARHQAAASLEPDADLAATVADAARTASARGAVYEAEQLAVHALRLTPARSIDHPERLLTLARYHLAAGDLTEARELLGPRVHELPAGRARCTGYLLLGEASDEPTEERCLVSALEEAGDEPDLRAAVLARRSTFLAVNHLERIAEAEAWAREGLMAARGVGADAEVRALSALAWTLALRGRPVDELSLTSHLNGSSSVYDGVVDRPLAVRLAFRGEIESARAVFGRLLRLAEERGDARSWLVLRVQLCELELRCGDVRTATTVLDEVDQWYGQDETWFSRTRLRAVLAAVAGLQVPGPTREDLAASGQLSAWDRLEMERALGVAAMFNQDYPRAVEHLQRVWDHSCREQVDDPGAFPVAAELVEALTLSGGHRSAGEVTARLQEVATAQNHPWGLVTARRCRAVMALAEGSDDAAAGELEQVAGEYGRMGLSFDQARTLLFVGAWQRRHKKRAAARVTLERARGAFERLGCSGWVGHAQLEISRLSGRRSGNDDLTPSERRVAELAASGLSNKEIATSLVVGVYTVEAHLRHTYAKLGIRSRSQLAQRLVRRG